MEHDMRKNLNFPSSLIEALSEFRHAGRYKSETAAVIDLLEMSTADIMGKTSYVYLAENESKSLYKIGFSSNPKKRQDTLTCPDNGRCKVICFVKGGRVMEKSLHILFSRHHHSGEWFTQSQDIKDWFDGAGAIYSFDALQATKESRVILGLDQHALLTKAANLMGMSLATYLRHCALEAAVERLREVGEH
jgi:hypothetical protein